MFGGVAFYTATVPRSYTSSVNIQIDPEQSVLPYKEAYATVMADPRYALYLAGWPRQGDYGLVAEQDGPVGAAWYRTFTEASHGYGFVAEDGPELSIAVIAPRRHEGIGRRLLVDLIDASLAQGYSAISLSVIEDNPARRLYESAGFVLIEKHGTSWTMVRHAGHSD